MKSSTKIIKEWLDSYPEYEQFETYEGIKKFMGGENLRKYNLEIGSKLAHFYLLYHNGDDSFKKQYYDIDHFTSEFRYYLAYSNHPKELIREYKLKQLLK